MSVTFFRPTAPIEVIDDQWGGYSQRAGAVNFGNATARVLLQILNRESDDLVGDLSGTDLDCAIQTCLLAANQGQVLAGRAVPSSMNHGRVRVTAGEGGLPTISTGPTMIDFGCPPERIRSGLLDLVALFAEARRNNDQVCWG